MSDMLPPGRAWYADRGVTRYELLDRIGVGGMAEIFRGKAVAAGGFEKPVAIKRILPHLSQDRRFVELLIAEAKVLSLLKHRNIVQIFDVGLGDDGKYFLVMEFVDGKDLGAVQRALEAAAQAHPVRSRAPHRRRDLRGARARARRARRPDGAPMSLVHRDVSPSNVLLSRAGEVKLTDFGIAKRAEQDADQGGAVRGKFAYISPEQARNEHVDRAQRRVLGRHRAAGSWCATGGCSRSSTISPRCARCATARCRGRREIDPRLPPEIDQPCCGRAGARPTRRSRAPAQFGAKLRSLRYSLEVDRRRSGDRAREDHRLDREASSARASR